MLRHRFAATAALAILTAATTARAADPLVSVDWLKANLTKSGTVILDVRSGAGLKKEGFIAGHIPGAIYTDYAKDGWREKNAAGVDGMLPAPAKLEALIGKLGIDNQTHVVLVPEGRTAADMGTATRLYWTFKVLGHDSVSILDGGIQAWLREVDKDKKSVNPLATGDVTPPSRTFKASVRQDMLIGRAEVQKAIEAKSATLVDNRPHDFYVGLTKSPAAKRAGTIPTAQSLPEGWLTQNGGGQFRSKSQLEQIYQVAKVPTSGDQIAFCNTGHWASLGWFVSSEILGNKSVKLYDGSMAEWTADANAQVLQVVKLD